MESSGKPDLSDLYDSLSDLKMLQRKDLQHCLQNFHGLKHLILGRGHFHHIILLTILQPEFSPLLRCFLFQFYRPIRYSYSGY
jgi:hypothetical protein